jgi:hypothetical protein
MDAVRLGADPRILRRRKGWTQRRLGAEAAASRWIVSEIECGRGDRLPLRVLEQVAVAAGGYLTGMLATLDRKVRPAPKLAEDRGWAVTSVSRLLVLPEASTPRRRVAEHAATFLAAFPDRNEVVRRRFRKPENAIRGLLFQSDAARAGTRGGRKR